MCLCSFINDYITTEGIIKTAELGIAVWGCIIASKGLTTWRTQLLETPKIDLAREIVEQFYNMKDLISRARNPFISFSPDEVRKFYEMDNLTEYQAGLAYRLMVLDKSIDQIQSFQKLRNRAKVLYTKDIENCFLGVNEIINHFKNACKTMMDESSKNNLLKDFGVEFRQGLYDRIYEKGDDDATNLKLREIINEVEYNLKPVYEAKTMEWKKLNSEVKDTRNE